MPRCLAASLDASCISIRHHRCRREMFVTTKTRSGAPLPSRRPVGYSRMHDIEMAYACSYVYASFSFGGLLGFYFMSWDTQHRAAGNLAIECLVVTTLTACNDICLLLNLCHGIHSTEPQATSQFNASLLRPSLPATTFVCCWVYVMGYTAQSRKQPRN